MIYDNNPYPDTDPYYDDLDTEPTDSELEGIEAEYNPTHRTFDTGATRDTDAGKLDYEGFLSPRVLRRFAEYMHENRVMSDGSLRDSDNWQKGIPLDAYMKSAFRHFFEWWEGHREGDVNPDALCALLFNVQGYLHEMLKDDAP